MDSSALAVPTWRRHVWFPPRRFLCVFGLVVALGACDDDGEQALVPTEYTAFCQGMAEAMCDWSRSCCEVDDLMDLLDLPGEDAFSVQLAREALSSHGNCRDVMHSMCEGQNRLPLDALLAERIQLDADAFNTCLEAFRSAAVTCDIGRATAPALARACAPELLFLGQRQAGESCHHELECNEETTCWTNFGNAAVPGICVAQVESESPCQINGMCGENQTCRSSVPPGQWCMPRQRQTADQWCFADDHCGGGLYCDVRLETCVARGGADAECYEDRHCRSGRCLDDTQRCAGFVGLDDQCDTHAECGDDGWCDPQHAASLCSAPLTVGEAGDECLPPGELTCETGLRCVNGFCTEPTEDGDFCTSSAQCQAQSYCAQDVGGRCTGRLGEGDRCTNSGECETSLFCDTAQLQCRARPGPDEACVVGGAQCGAGYRCDEDSTTCVPGRSDGEECNNTAECGAGLLCRRFAGRCAERVSREAACNDHEACTDADFCDPRASHSLCSPARQVGEGESCSSASEVCGPGLYCYYGSTCRLLGQVGESCSTPQQPCAASLVCASSTCQTPVLEGGSCTSSAACDTGLVCNYVFQCGQPALAGGSCRQDEQCVADTYCYGSACQNYVNLGELCNAYTQRCGAGLYCDPAAVPGPKCAARATLGAACDTTILCEESLWCNSGVCAAAPLVGDACGQYGQPVCPANSFCDPTTSVCVAYGGAGDTCSAGVRCGSDLYCRSYGGRCAQRRAAREDCDTRSLCTLGHDCVSEMTCEPFAEEGESCERGAACAEGLYCHESWAICLELQDDLAPGRTCRVHGECRSGLCANHVCLAACIGGLWSLESD